jgi:hypothetical protein
MSCELIETPGIYTIGLYVNNGIKLRRPDPAIENEVDIISHQTATVFVPNHYLPKWERIISYSENYSEQYEDIFSFSLFGIRSEIRNTLQYLRARREGFIVEIRTLDNQSFVFPTPVFVSANYEKPNNQRSWQIEMKYRQPTKNDYLYKLNNLIFSYSYIYWGADSAIFGATGEIPVVSQ